MEQIDLNATDWVSNTPNIYYTAVSGFAKLAGESEISTYVSRATFVGGQVISITVNLVKDPDDPGKVIVSTVVAGVIMYFVADAIITGIAVVTAAAIAAVTGVAATVAVVAIAAIAIAVVAIAATFVGNELQSAIYDGLESFEKGTIISPEITGSFTQQELILQSLNDNPNFCMDAFPDYVNYRQIVTIKNYNGEILGYNNSTKTGTIDAADIEHIKEYLHTLYDQTNADKIALNSITYDITQSDNLLIRNAIFDIPTVSFLLSHIDIHSGDVLDLGDKGLYKVVSGDTMSKIAEANGMTTQELLSYNTWLIDEGRVEFDQDKVLVANLEPSDFTDKDHNLLGCELEDRLIDHNDGDDTLLGMGGDDYLDGGKGADQLVGGTGFDTYISDNGDKIFDEDGEGEVYFDKTLLTGGKKEAGSGCEPTEEDGSSEYKGNGGTYTLNGDTLTILNLSNERMVA